MKTGRWWPLGVGLVLAVTVVANVALLYTASRDPSYAVEPDYYRRAVTWDSTVALRERSAALGWQADVGLGPPDGQGATLTVFLRSRDGTPLDSAQVQAEASHNAHAAELYRVTLAAAGPGLYAARIPSTRRGLWRVDLTARHGQDAFVERVTADNEPGPTP